MKRNQIEYFNWKNGEWDAKGTAIFTAALMVFVTIFVVVGSIAEGVPLALLALLGWLVPLVHYLGFNNHVHILMGAKQWQLWEYYRKMPKQLRDEFNLTPEFIGKLSETDAVDMKSKLQSVKDKYYNNAAAMFKLDPRYVEFHDKVDLLNQVYDENIKELR